MSKDFETELDEIVAGAQPSTEPTEPVTEEPTGGEPVGEPDNTGEVDNVDAVDDSAGQQPSTEPPAQSSEPDAPSEPSFDVNAYLRENSEGLLNGEEDLKASIIKLKQYEELETKVKVLESEKESLFANDYIKTLNELHKQGKTSEQISEFQKLHSLGDLSTLDAKEILIQNKIDQGASREVATKLIEREYGLNKISLDESILTPEELDENKEELELINEKMKLDADPIRAKLQSKLDEISKPVDATQEALNKAAAEKAYKAKLEPFVEKLSEAFPSQVDFGEVKFEVGKEFKDNVKSFAFEYFLDKPVDETTVKEFEAVQKAIFLAQNHEKISKALIEKGRELGRKERDEEFVNNNGVGRQGAALSDASQTMSQSDLAAEAMKMAD